MRKVLLVALLTLWTCGALIADGMVARITWQRWRSLGFATTEGEVVRSEVFRYRGGGRGGPSYRPEIHFTYSVDGKAFTSQQYRMQQTGSGWREESERIVAAFPVGRRVAVRYDPRDPSVAVLHVGVGHEELGLAMFVLPFNCVLIGMGALAFQALRARVLWGQTGGLSAAEDSDRVRVRLAEVPVLAAVLWTAGLMGFAGSFFGLFGIWGPPSKGLVTFLWSIIIVATVTTGIWAWIRQRRGDWDLVIDAGARQLTLPRSSERKERVSIPIDDVLQIGVEEGGQQQGPAYDVRVQLRERPSHVITQFYTKSRAERFAAWLRDRMPAPSGPLAE